ncbi:unnamed protein product [Cylindrotheca closterium]|uniref:VWFD domain-containing protein n=1 Tax=Cylindrotheca closterium TaxID=2856 RepID=A0AAD2CWZ5_9STRA|nr:unnamed protein product [Cylindrotheca closterium]
MKLNSNILTAVVAAAALANVVNAASVATCAEQSSCISFNMTKLETSACSVAGDCTVEVCMDVNGGNEGCGKGSVDSFSHMCMQASSSGCPQWQDPDELIPKMGAGDDTTCSASGIEDQAAFDGKCTDGKDVTMCQEGKPGQTLYWILKDGSDTTQEDVTIPMPFVTEGSDSCESSARCFNYQYKCGTDGSPRQSRFERTWAFTIPEGTGDACDVCAGDESDEPEDPVVQSPPSTPTDPSPSSPSEPASSPSSPTEPAATTPSSPTEPGSPTDGGDPPITGGNPPPATPPATGSEGSPTPGSNGDPHFKTWNGEHFEFHGQCDLVLAKDADFAEGLGLDIQIRTKLVRYWSYIKRAAIRIGEDILEIEGSSDLAEIDPIFWINFDYQPEDVKTIGGFPLKVITGKARFRKHHFEIDLSSKYPGVKIEIHTMKEFIKVDFVGASEEAFGNVQGILGEFKSGKTLARDGQTVVDDYTLLGNEWQVQPVDTMLFHDISDPQFPKRCVLPEDPQGQRRRRLEESSVTVEDAEKACSTLADELSRKDCVYDIIATQDMDMVGAF